MLPNPFCLDLVKKVHLCETLENAIVPGSNFFYVVGTTKTF